MVRRIIFLVTMTALVLALTAGSALGYTDYVKYMSKQTTSTTSTEGMYALGCMWCHGWDKLATPNTSDTVNVMSVRTGLLGFPNISNTPASVPASETWINLYQQYGQPYGPHGGYSNTTDRCKVCHDVHAANGDKRLLPQNTVAAICETCHDFTQGISIYGAIRAQTGQAPAGGHFIQGLASSEASTNPNTGIYIPGGQLGAAYDPIFPLTGGTTLYSAASLAGNIGGEQALTCTDCHTPHGNTSLVPFKGDRVRLGTSILVTACNAQPAGIDGIQFPITLPIVGALPAGYNLGAVALPLSPNSPAYADTAQTLTPAGTALALSLLSAGVLNVSLETTTPTATNPMGLLLVNANLTRVASNKLLRDYINNVDLRANRFGGTPPGSTAVTYNQTLTQWDPVLGGGTITSANAPWVNGQNGATAEYGSGWCYTCHQGRIGNVVNGVTLNADFASVDTTVNHPTLMNQPYRTVAVSNTATAAARQAQGFAPAGGSAGMALSNAGFTFFPVAANPDGRVGTTDATRPTAPICQQCHEDSRDVESEFRYTDTDKSVPMSNSVNGVLQSIGVITNATGSFIYAGNPQFQNFPHETLNLRLLVEGGQSAQVGGGNNDDLCLNCHVPGSTVRLGTPAVPGSIYNTKDMNGFME